MKAEVESAEDKEWNAFHDWQGPCDRCGQPFKRYEGRMTAAGFEVHFPLCEIPASKPEREKSSE